MLNFETVNQQYIGGVWQDGKSNRELIDLNPYTNEVITKFKMATKDDIHLTYVSAQKAKSDEWDNVNAYKKCDVFTSALEYIQLHKNEIISLLTKELGSTRLKGTFEVDITIQCLRDVITYPVKMDGKILPSSIEHKENRVYRVPVGVVGVISPSNFPFLLTMKAVASALATGNGVVVKPHEDSPLTGGVLIGKIFEQTKLPKGLLNIIITDISEIRDSFIEHPIPRVISYTGSTNIGRHIGQLCAKNLKRSLLELGGNSAFIVMDDVVDLEYVARCAVVSRFMHQGQVCMAANRILVQQTIFNQFLEKFVKKVSELKVGDPQDPTTHMGPLINHRQAEELTQLVQKAVGEGVKCVVGNGHVIKGNLVEPTVLVNVTPEMTIYREELFGPVVCVIPFTTEEEAIKMTNDTRFGLSACVHTKDIEHGVKIAKQIETGAVHVNDITINDEPLVPFGGEKQSGIGRINGQGSIDAFTTSKWISINHDERHLPF
ncbi:unnamed protein product [Didymodactylos carnosus]|uniref:Aldehyde dehydrogenase domain-containing protein n=1 Tax=Didymodactylos carnosus TaxID=1234261 RepID=A0A815NE29_9BILA|nr:unnamed protein product [Didymodactylos carnosus]CAF1435277.1 unnamed protein product [Didymodactylos carnosus]CAF4190171.1 unnamed protein product [Didymodactylos carnosus]CAF4312795.1 unnamed protein product [Didymodactylos carnosus]